MKRLFAETADRQHRAAERPWHGRYNERAKHRLRIAATLLHRRDLSIDSLGDFFYPAVLRAIDELGERRRAWLRGLVDWVEAYDNEERLRSVRTEHRSRSRSTLTEQGGPRDDVRHAERFLACCRPD